MVKRKISITLDESLIAKIGNKPTLSARIEALLHIALQVDQTKSPSNQSELAQQVIALNEKVSQLADDFVFQQSNLKELSEWKDTMPEAADLATLIGDVAHQTLGLDQLKEKLRYLESNKQT